MFQITEGIYIETIFLSYKYTDNITKSEKSVLLSCGLSNTGYFVFAKMGINDKILIAVMEENQTSGPKNISSLYLSKMFSKNWKVFDKD